MANLSLPNRFFDGITLFFFSAQTQLTDNESKASLPSHLPAAASGRTERLGNDGGVGN